MSNESSAETKLWRQFIYRLMMFDSNVRYLCDKTVQDKTTVANENDSVGCDDNDDDFYNFGNVHNETGHVTDNNEHIHPMDIFMAVFHCSDDIARQCIFTKLSTCQFALPLLVPDLCTEEIEIPLSALQQIKKTLKTKHESDGKSVERYMSRFIFSAKVPTVSFIRLGTSSNSKSQIMNNIISKKRHPVFFSRHCSGSTTNRPLLDGVAEIFWYCPGGRKDDIFETCVAFINLHGNAQMYPNQLAFIQDISTVIVLLLSENELEMEEKKVVKHLQKSNVLSDLNDQYHKTWTEIRQNTTTKDKERGIKLQNILKEITENIKHATFNVQHILREIAQLYEVLQPMGEEKMIHGIDINRFPEIGAEMLLSGYPLELMDGDVNHIPLEWISAVFDKLICKLGDKKVFVLAVLGLQSSGKSTLLNTMFGFQLAVSAGRCTTGAVMQLVPVEEKLREQLHFDFVLVLDTEGLRSTEMNQSSTLCHDNELATFVVGLGDVTLINIMGENPSEILDILQICFQAFLRMTSVEVKPRCFFVHQNVSETTAADKNQEGRRQLIAKLDEISRVVAEAEDREVSGFSDIIQFDVETQVFYIKNFFEGDPPMAPPNPSYSQNVQELKTKLLNVAKWQSKWKPPTLSEFRQRLQDLWTALMEENFVFHFRNSLHVMVYSKLEDQYGEWSWTLRKHALETQNSLHYKICSGEIGDTQMKQMGEEIQNSIGGVYREVKEDSDKYFTEEKHPEILIQWKDNVEKRLEGLKHELIEEAHTKSCALLKSKKCRLELDRKREEYVSDLLQKSKNLAANLKGKQQNDEELREEFNKLWTTWAIEVSSKEPKAEPVNMQGITEKILQEQFKKYWDRIIQHDFQFNVKDHIRTGLKDTVGFWAGWNCDKLLEIGKKTTQEVHEAVNKILIEREREGFDVNDSFIHRLLKKIESVINSLETECEIKFKGLYKAQVSFDACSKAVKSLKSLSENFKKSNDPLTYFNSQQDGYFKMFRNFCNEAASVKIFADFLGNHVKSVLTEAVIDKVSIGIVHDMKSNHSAFSGNRSNLENHILKYLAEKENFDMFRDYILEPECFFKDFITEHVQEYLRNRTKVEYLFNSEWSLLAELILRECSSVSTKIAENQGNASMWLDEFCARLCKHIPISRKDLKNIEKEDISDTEFLKKSIEESFREITNKESIKNIFDQIFKAGPIFFKFRNRPDDILFKQMSGCWEQCPFCKAVCTNTIPNHDSDHSVQMHRCQALGGLFHEFSQLFKFSEQFYLQFCTEMKVNDEFKPPGSNKWIPFSDYREAGPPYNRWNITPDGSEQHYWKWFICTFQSQLEDLYQLKFEGSGEIPKGWRHITKQDALRQLNIQ
ncbi:interferon-induced very large GTPase 1-like [Chanos chanos]|uniref:Interferon-induced very large GTPase 1-like n=1 Tax=Chanos chanos TaxID=29144 RepID=A0A6J2VTW0_CHACN|nr:interferon-induced very large GTPase 1-like [Chanos chanos]